MKTGTGDRATQLQASAPAKAPARKRASTSPSTAARRVPGKSAVLTPERALARTRELLQVHQEQARQTPAWRLLEEPHVAHSEGDGHAPAAEVAAKLQELHAGESRMRAIQGSASTHDRRNQRKRDHR
jgi:hypothetical protein